MFYGPWDCPGLPRCSWHTHTHRLRLWVLSGTTRVSWYQKKHSPTHTYRGHQSSLICFLHLIRSMASSLFNPCAWQFFHNLHKFSLVYLLAWHPPLHTPYFFTQSLGEVNSAKSKVYSLKSEPNLGLLSPNLRPSLTSHNVWGQIRS